jgi:hypothetical protein
MPERAFNLSLVQTPDLNRADFNRADFNRSLLISIPHPNLDPTPPPAHN